MSAFRFAPKSSRHRKGVGECQAGLLRAGFHVSAYSGKKRDGNGAHRIDHVLSSKYYGEDAGIPISHQQLFSKQEA
jgi:hypothetical protein